MQRMTSDEPTVAELLVVSALCSFTMQICVNFPLSRLSIADNFTGFVEFVPAAAYGCWRCVETNDLTLHSSLGSTMLTLWSLRLTAHLLLRMSMRSAVDSRLGDPGQRSTLPLLTFWLIHGSWGIVVSLPVTLLNGSSGGQTSFGALGYTGCLLWLCGFVLESYADRIKLNMHLGGDKKLYYCMGRHWLWRFSRNPNLCGEALCWIGVTLLVADRFGVFSMAAAIALLSPAMTLALMLGEAVLISEWNNNRRFRDDPEFLVYRSKTSLFWLCPQFIYAQLPSWVRRCFFCDWQCYRRHQRCPSP